MLKKDQEILDFIKSKDANRATFSDTDIEYISTFSGKGGTKAESFGVLDQYFTPSWVCEIMYKLAQHHGYRGGTVLEPSMGIGNMIAPFPDKSLITGFEPDLDCFRIAQLRHPEASFHPYYFEAAFLEPLSENIFGKPIKDKRTWLNGYPFSLVISNPPFGQNRNFYSGRLKKHIGYNIPQIEIAFMYYGMLMLKRNGLLVYITADSFMRNGNKYEPYKEALSHLAELVDAYRLPPIFKRTKVCPDILVFRRK